MKHDATLLPKLRKRMIAAMIILIAYLGSIAVIYPILLSDRFNSMKSSGLNQAQTESVLTALQAAGIGFPFAGMTFVVSELLFLKRFAKRIKIEVEAQ